MPYICGTCGFCHELKGNEKVDPERGQCRRFPPQNVVIHQIHRTIVKGNTAPMMSEMVQSGFPVVMFTWEACGEYREKQNGAASS